MISERPIDDARPLSEVINFVVDGEPQTVSSMIMVTNMNFCIA